MEYRVAKEKLDPELVQRLGRIDLIARVIAQGVGHGVHHSQRRGFSTEFSDFKPYVPGDDLRMLDWRVYARTDRLFVKRFQAETNLEVVLLLDATRSMAWRWQDRISKLEYAANLLAALACIHISQQDQVGLLVHDGAALHHLPPRARRRQLDEIFAILAELRPGAAETFPQLVAGLTQIKRHRGRVIVCSDLEENEEEIRRALTTLAAGNDEVFLFHLLDQAEVTLPFTELTHLEDSETGELVPVNLAELKRRHAATVARFRQEWADFGARWDVSYLPVDTGLDYVEVIQSLMGTERQRRGEHRAAAAPLGR